MSGIQEWLSFYFKSPMHAPEVYDRLRVADALLHDLIPAYRGLVTGSVSPKPALAKAAPANVTVTLVRWPYT